MYILGFNCNIHDASAALIKDGVLISACEEERFNRIKHYGGFPVQAIHYCCREGGITPQDIDTVVFYWQPLKGLHKRAINIIKNLPRSISFFGKHNVKRGTPSVLFDDLFIRNRLKGLRIGADFHFLEHHLAHSAGAFLISPYEESAILSVDLAGEITTTYFGIGIETQIKTIKEIEYPHSLGLFYAALTQYLGYNPNSDEYKVMGLASYGEPAYYNEFKKMVRILPGGKFELDLSHFAHHLGYDLWYGENFVKRLGPPCKNEDELEDKRFRDIACSAQLVFEDTIRSMAIWLKEKSKSNYLCLTGGCALNSVANGKLLKEGIFRDIFIQPAPYDAGCSIGAAYYWWNSVLGNPRRFIFEHSYLGPAYTSVECEMAIKRRGLKYRFEKEVAKKVAELLAKGKIIGWFQGRIEWGPRALGNRSILADPRRAEMKDIVNAKVKFREPYRPFAPSVLEEKASEFFACNMPSPYMLFVFDVYPSKRALIPAVTHVDGTSRIQTVSKRTNPRYWELIKEFDNLTGIPLILNTSFNRRGEPIVCSPGDAIECFLHTDIDYLVLEDYLCWK